ncbi:polynucleotide kinase [Amnibacterium sp.]|uniref:phosphatase domain-containing protein n=1 Tax=Amnibacterium sp. TaxID=1872496 RepID=UPI002636A0D1|nr:polynucleotide kinase [Amnibacterium sp.]MCU1472235.1 polynucleotide kinase [Amnibacterium sp.]
MPDAVLIDLDGTLAIIGDRDPYDASTAEVDELNEQVAWVAHSWLFDGTTEARQDRAVVLVSGRQEKDRRPTERWLDRHGVVYDALRMRATGDPRNDAIVKRELYERHIRGRYNVVLVIDDRRRVVDMWRSLGLQCWQVAPGDF